MLEANVFFFRWGTFGSCDYIYIFFWVFFFVLGLAHRNVGRIFARAAVFEVALVSGELGLAPQVKRAQELLLHPQRGMALFQQVCFLYLGHGIFSIGDCTRKHFHFSDKRKQFFGGEAWSSRAPQNPSLY